MALRMATGKLYSSPYNLAIYLGSFLLVLLGPTLSTNWTIVIAGLLFLGWDVGFALSPTTYCGRDISNILEQATLARTLMSYFLPFYAVFVGALFALEPGQGKGFFELIGRSGMLPVLAVAPFLVATVASLFIPIQLARDDQPSVPTLALRALFGASVFLEKLTLFIFGHIVLRLLFTLASGR